MLEDRIQQNLRTALKEKKETEVSVLRMLNAAILIKEKEKRYKLSQEKPETAAQDLEKESQLIEEEITEVVASEIKKRKQSISEFEKGDRQDLVAKEKEELDILEIYLPEVK